MTEIISTILIALGGIFILFGVIGLFKFPHFYPRILISAKIDTVGTITIVAGIAVRHGISYFTGKLVLLIGIILILDSLTTHICARSAYLSGHPLEREE